MIKSNQSIETLQFMGLSEKAARMYLAALQLGEGTMQDLAKSAKVPRTSLYYVVEELLQAGALVLTKKGKRSYYVPIPPTQLMQFAEDRLQEAKENLATLEQEAGKGKNHIVEILHGPQGFKLAWEAILQTKEKEYRIITSGESFLDYVREKYILHTIIQRKKMLRVKSFQLISDSPYARKIIQKDQEENRVSKLLPINMKLGHTVAFTERRVLIISPRSENVIVSFDSPKFATTLRAMFDAVWETLP